MITVSDAIKFLEQLRAERGDIDIGADFSAYDDELNYSQEFGTIFGK